MSAPQSPSITAKTSCPSKRVAKRRFFVVMAIALGALASGCAAPPLYDWNSYEGSLQNSYITHNDEQALANLEATLSSAQRSGRRIPPGACAEYGFLLYKHGKREAAIKYFQLEAQLFPESKLLMDKLVAKINEQTPGESKPSTEGGAIQ
jgi:hypothetical protein